MVEQTQTNRQLLPTNCLSVSDHFVGFTLKGLRFVHEQEKSYQDVYAMFPDANSKRC